MRSTHSFAIDFITRKCKENKQRALIYARVTVNGDRKEISLKEFIDAKDWNNEKQLVKGKTIQVQTILLLRIFRAMSFSSLADHFFIPG